MPKMLQIKKFAYIIDIKVFYGASFYAYDQFIEWQIAGDLMPNPSKKQILATALNRNNQTSSETGIDDEEYRLEYVLDRYHTIGRLFGFTDNCTRCHDHKFDPISQKDYFSMEAFFDNMDQ
ncbi:DUF1549 domain-containing protein [Lunatimonas salinarum]|uniref:DUF1549 domain-containing protein n=1 Tax=Lunatimonas salinarum TaxID=1774590 RepID=UPI001ADF79AB|nr:DUF1549 domain-containing protein [Lunatimonas salinarum]